MLLTSRRKPVRTTCRSHSQWYFPERRLTHWLGFVTLASKGGALPGRYSTSSDSLACRCRRDGRTQPHETLTSTAATSLIRMRGLGWVRLGSQHSNRHAVVAHSAMCVQSFDDSLNSAIHITYRISLRSSSLREPRYPLLRVVSDFRLARPSPH